MIDVELQPGPAAGALARGFAACLASVTEVPVTDLPAPDDDLAHALGAWRSWLAEHGSGLVPIADPANFQWAGWWIAVVGDPPGGLQDDETEVAVLAFGTPPGIVLSPQAPALVGRATADLRIRAAYAVASLEPVLPQLQVALDLRGTVEGLAVAPTAEASMQLLQVAQARARRGLDGDRYAAGAGTFSPRAGRRPGCDLTLIAAEVLDEMAASGPALDFAGTRRNVLTRGIDVNALVGRRFRIGRVLCEGRRLCEPCAHLDRLGGPGVLRPMIHRGGLRADILTDGEIRLGEPILPAWSPLDAGGSRAAAGNHGPDRRARPAHAGAGGIIGGSVALVWAGAVLAVVLASRRGAERTSAAGGGGVELGLRSTRRPRPPMNDA